MLENVHGRRRRYNNLGTTLHPPDEILAFVEMFICQFYQPGTGFSQVKELSSMLMYAYYLLLSMLMSEPTAKKKLCKEDMYVCPLNRDIYIDIYIKMAYVHYKSDGIG